MWEHDNFGREQGNKDPPLLSWETFTLELSQVVARNRWVAFQLYLLKCHYICPTFCRSKSHPNVICIFLGHLPFLLELGPISRKSQKRMGPGKPFVRLPPGYAIKLVFSYELLKANKN